jgi:hypothetical protein
MSLTFHVTCFFDSFVSSIMPPRLKAGGTPIGQRIPATPPVLELCQCWDCHDNPGTDPHTQLPIPGRFLAPAELKAHRRRQKHGLFASTALAGASAAAPTFTMPSSAANPFPIQTSSPTPPVSSSTCHQSRPVVDSTSDASQPAKYADGDTTIETLRAIHASVERLKATNWLSYGPLIFTSPPLKSPASRSRIRPFQSTDPCTLDPTAPANSLMIGGEKTLFNYLQVVRNNSQAKDVNTRLLCNVIIPQLENAIVSLQHSQRAEWERQRMVAVKAGLNAVDTSESLGFFIACLLMLYP